MPPNTKSPHEPAPEDILPGCDGEKPVFVGHDWMSGTPRHLSARVACLDYSVAAGGKLCAYRWNGERDLGDVHFCCDTSDGSAIVKQGSAVRAGMR